VLYADIYGYTLSWTMVPTDANSTLVSSCALFQVVS